MGYEPDAFARRFHQREDILEALEEGILAIDREGRIIFLNAAAAQMLSLAPEAAHGPAPSTPSTPLPPWTAFCAPGGRSTT